jgi:hypothetical protein
LSHPFSRVTTAKPRPHVSSHLPLVWQPFPSAILSPACCRDSLICNTAVSLVSLCVTLKPPHHWNDFFKNCVCFFQTLTSNPLEGPGVGGLDHLAGLALILKEPFYRFPQRPCNSHSHRFSPFRFLLIATWQLWGDI